MSELYNEQPDPKRFEVIFVSADPTEKEFKMYYSQMPWLAIPWHDPRAKALAEQFKV